MNTVKLEYKIPEDKVIEYNGIEIKICPFIDMAQQLFLINKYIEDYFEIKEDSIIPSSEYNYFEAEYKLKNYILQLLTNVDVENFNDNIYVDQDFWELVFSSIVNFEFFLDVLDTTLEDIKAQIILQNSLGKVLNNLSEKANILLEKIADMTPEEIEKLQKESLEMLERLEKSSVLGNSAQEE